MKASPTSKTPTTPQAPLTVEAPKPKSKAKVPKTPKAPASSSTAKLAQGTGAKASAQPPVNPLAGVSIRAEALSYRADLHRARVLITTPTGRYYKLVPGVRTATKAEALTAAQSYREQLLARGELPP